MDYEKLHKDTITKLQEMVNSGKITVKTARGICADFVPESEDERIRKELIRAFNSLNTLETWNGIKRTDILAWLEKQGQTFTKKDVDDAYLKGVCDTKQELEKQGEQKPEWSEEDEAYRRLLIDIMDVEHRDGIFSINPEDISIFKSDVVTVKRIKDWLKSLKERYTWRPSDAQIASLTIACDRNDRIGFDLTQLLKDLKKLKEY